MSSHAPSNIRRTSTGKLVGAGLTAAVAASFAVAASADATTVPADSAADSETEFPVTIEHAFGATTIESEPQRVVSIGFTDHDTLLALGVEPVAIRHWYGDYEYVWPWADEALGDQQPGIIPAEELNFEQIASFEPDLIIGQYVGLEADEYESLSAIAPTVAQPGDFPRFGATWELMARNLGAATGRSAEAEAVIADVEAQFAAIRAAHPEFAGVELAYAGAYGVDAPQYYVETHGSTRMRVLEQLGFVVPGELEALGADAFYHDISGEQLDLLDQQVVLWEPAVHDLLDDIEQNQLYRGLAVHTEDRDIFMTDPLIAGAMAHSSVLSLPVVLEWLEPELVRAVGNLDG